MDSGLSHFYSSISTKDLFGGKSRPRFRRSKTKIVGKLGKKTEKVGILGGLLDAGMSVARLNFSKKDHGYYANMVAMLRQAMAAGGG